MGVKRRSAQETERRRPHPFRAKAHTLRGLVFAYDGRRWSAEAVTVIDTGGTVGLYAYELRHRCVRERDAAPGGPMPTAGRSSRSL